MERKLKASQQALCSMVLDGYEVKKKNDSLFIFWSLKFRKIMFKNYHYVTQNTAVQRPVG